MSDAESALKKIKLSVAEEVHGDKVGGEEVEGDDVDSEEVDGDDVDSEEVDGDEVDSDEVDGDEVDSEEVEDDEVKGDEVDIKEVDIDEVDGDEVEEEFSLKVMINKEKSKVLFVEADNYFTDILLSFLTLPLGRIVKLLEKHYGNEAPTIGSLSSLYHSLANLDSSHFCTEGAKLTLLNPTSSFEADYSNLKLDICDYQPAEYFSCKGQQCYNRFRSVSVYYDGIRYCRRCKLGSLMMKEATKKRSLAAASDGVFTTRTTPFIISDDLQILPNVTGLVRIISILGLSDSDTDKAKPINVTFRFSEIMDLMKASLISQTPFSDVILNRTRQTNSSVIVESEPEASFIEEVPNSKNMILKVTIQKSTGKLLYAQAEEDFVQFLFSFSTIPLGGVERLLGRKSSCIKTIKNLYWSTTDLEDSKYFKTPSMKKRLIKLNLYHGFISENHLLPLTEECLPSHYCDFSVFRSVNFLKGKGNYLKGKRTYHVTDDLTVTPFCIVSILSSLKKMKIPVSDIEELELEIGLEEGLSILKASLTSTSALNDGLINYISNKARTKSRICCCS